MIIFILVKAYGLPVLPAYLNLTKGQHVKQGVNFAYSGSTANNKSFFDQRGLDVPLAAYSLTTQFEWFQKLKPSLCTGKEGFIISPLFIMFQQHFCFLFLHIITHNVIPFYHRLCHFL